MSNDDMFLKDIKDIDFNVNFLNYTIGDIDSFVIQEAKIEGVIMEREKLRVILTDGSNKAYFYIKYNNIVGRNILNDLLLSGMIKNMPLETFLNLKLRQFKLR